MSEMLERVKRAICKSRTCEGVWCCEWPANRSRLKCPVRDGGYDDAAHAALEALREPTDDMCEAGAAYYHDNYQDGRAKEQTTAPLIWRAMIDVALTNGVIQPSRQEGEPT